MSRGVGSGGLDEPSRGPNDHSELLSELDSYDLAVATHPTAPGDSTDRAGDAGESGDEDPNEGEKPAFAFDTGADPDETFPQSVASGGPTPTGVILWTRIAPDVFDPDAPLAVQVARDEAIEDPIYEGIVTDAERLEAHDHTIEIDLDGELSPGTEYWYRFVYRDVASRVGRCRTLPAPDDSPDSIRFAVLACQNYLKGDTLHDRFELWRSFEFGDLLTVAMTDERLFRDPPREAIPTAENVGPHREPPGRTMLGDEQRDWLVDTITGAETTWTVWTDEVLTVPLRIGSGPLSVYPVQGGWDGYTRERMHITESIAAADVDNFVTLTGDLHCYVAAYKQTSYPGRVEGGTGVATGERLGVEFMTPAITSLNVAEALHLTRGWRGTITEPVLSWLVPAMNPHIEFFNSHNWGYSVVEFTPEECTYVGYAVDKTENSPDADRSVVAAYRVPEGRVELEDVTTRIRERAELARESGR